MSAQSDNVAYRAYIASPEWARKREAKFRQAGRRCDECGRDERLEVHHLTYRHFGREPLADLQVLCHWCHMAEHGRNADIPDVSGPTTADLVRDARQRDALRAAEAFNRATESIEALSAFCSSRRQRKRLRAAINQVHAAADEQFGVQRASVHIPNP